MAFCGLAVGLAAASPALANDGVRLGETYRGVVHLKTYGSPQVPLPPGDWKLVALGDSVTNTNNIRVLKGHFIQTGGQGEKDMRGRVSFSVTDSPVRGSWIMPAICSRTDFIANFSKPVAAEGYDCAWITAYSLIRPNRSGDELNQFYDYVDQNKIKKPPTVVGVSYAISDGRSYLTIDYAFNPDIEKIPSASTTLWHRDRYKEDPKRVVYVERLSNWAQAWRKNVADAYKNRLPASFAGADVFPRTTTAPVAAPSKALGKPLAQVAELGKSYRDVMPLNIVGAPQVPLPPGEWKLVVLDELESEASKIRLVRGYLVQAKGKVMTGHIYFIAPDGTSARGWKSNACARKEPLVDLTINSGSGQGYDCSTITSYVGTRPKSSTRQLTKFHDYLDQNGIEAPPTMLNVSYDISDNKTYLLAEYRFNPAVEGVRADSIVAWRPDRFAEDSKRAAYVEKMKSWAQSWHPKVAAGYKSALPKTATLN